jgi:hypothetical protein
LLQKVGFAPGCSEIAAAHGAHPTVGRGGAGGLAQDRLDGSRRGPGL